MAAHKAAVKTKQYREDIENTVKRAKEYRRCAEKALLAAKQDRLAAEATFRVAQQHWRAAKQAAVKAKGQQLDAAKVKAAVELKQRLTFKAEKSRSGNKKGSNTRYFLIEGGDSKVYYFREKPNGYDTPLKSVNFDKADGWFQLPKSNPNDNTQIRLSKGKFNSDTLVIQASDCSKMTNRGSLTFRLTFESKEKAEEYREKLRARCPTVVIADRRRRLTASEILARRKRRPTSAEVVLGPLLEQIRRLQ